MKILVSKKIFFMRPNIWKNTKYYAVMKRMLVWKRNVRRFLRATNIRLHTKEKFLIRLAIGYEINCSPVFLPPPSISLIVFSSFFAEAFDMSRLAHLFIFGLCLASMFQKGIFLQLTEQVEQVFNQVSRELPLSECDMIIVSSSPIQGEMCKIFHLLQGESHVHD